jgi:hypothetical protein
VSYVHTYNKAQLPKAKVLSLTELNNIATLSNKGLIVTLGALECRYAMFRDAERRGGNLH